MTNPATGSGLEATGIKLEGFRPGLCKPVLDPLSLTVVAGLAQGSCLAPHPDVSETMASLQGIPSTSSMFAEAQAAIPLLQAQMTTVTGGGPAGMGQMIAAAQAHCSTAAEIASSCDTMSTQSFGDFGSGISSMSSLATRGIDAALGALPSVGSLMTTMGGMFDMSNMSGFGTAAGFATFLISNKLGTASGLVPMLASMGISKENIGDPLNEAQVQMAMSKINDPSVLSTIQDQYGTSGSCSSMADMLNPASFGGTPPGFVGTLAGIGSHFGDMGAMFKSPGDAASMLSGMSAPSIPNLDGAASDFGSHMADMKDKMGSMMGTGSGAGGLPSTGDFFPTATGNPAMSALLGGATSGGIQDLVASLAPSTSLFAAAGIPLGVPPVVNLQSALGFATGGLASMATSSLSAGKDLLNSLKTPDAYGDAITAKMDAAANAQKMADLGGIPPLKFT